MPRLAQPGANGIGISSPATTAAGRTDDRPPFCRPVAPIHPARRGKPPDCAGKNTKMGLRACAAFCAVDKVPPPDATLACVRRRYRVYVLEGHGVLDKKGEEKRVRPQSRRSGSREQTHCFIGNACPSIVPSGWASSGQEAQSPARCALVERPVYKTLPSPPPCPALRGAFLPGAGHFLSRLAIISSVLSTSSSTVTSL